MNKNKIHILLNRWTMTVDAGIEISKEKARKSLGGLYGRIKRTRGRPVVFDCETYNEQKDFQNQLCGELPQWADVIRSEPEIMDGYAWTRADFIDLYYSHYIVVIERLRRIINATVDV